MQLYTDKGIKANKPDIIIKDHTNNACQLVDVTIPSDRNASIKEVEQFSTYKDFEMWKMKATKLPVAIGALGVIKKGMRSNRKDSRENKLRRITEDHTDGHCSHHILRKVQSNDL